MLVVGGTYKEICRFPPIEELYGSGLRGVSAISNITDSDNRFFTYSGESDETLSVYGDTYEFEFNNIQAPQTILFDYLHNHSEPVVYPENPEKPKDKIGPVEDEAVLRFGMEEGSAIVEGNRVVYDPQSKNFEDFHENGSEANELALVLNQTEGMNITGKRGPKAILKHLCKGRRCDAAVLKQGPAGALVSVDGDLNKIPVYRTPLVRNIGSGDIFSAVFAVYWAEKHHSAVEAAIQASLATAFFSHEGTLPIPESPEEALDIELQEISPEIESNPPTIYLAGPFFSIGQYYLVEEVYNSLIDWGADVFSPYHNVGRTSEHTNPEEIANRDLRGLEKSDVVLALLDGEDPGTFFEIGYAKDNEIPVVAYKSQTGNNNHTMLEGTNCEIYEDLSSAIFNAIWTYYD